MKVRNLITTGLISCMGLAAQAQEAKAAEPKGKAIVQVFSNFNADFSREAESLGFELECSYLGYEYKLDGGLTVKGVMDIGKSSDVSDYSVYTSVNVSKTAAVYARWDELFAGNTASIDPLRPSGSSPLKRDSAAAIVGAQFKLGKYVKVAPNVRMQLDRATGKDTYEECVSCYFGL